MPRWGSFLKVRMAYIWYEYWPYLENQIKLKQKSEVKQLINFTV